jgi:hypothetical protein
MLLTTMLLATLTPLTASSAAPAITINKCWAYVNHEGLWIGAHYTKRGSAELSLWFMMH